MARPRLLDLYCGQGGAGEGYRRAGFDVVGVDIKDQPRYPLTFVQRDALAFLREHGGEFDAIHASPPCKAHTTLATLDNVPKHDDLLTPTRELLEKWGRPYVIENVPGAPMRADVLLCGSMFDLKVKRHRWFESNVPLFHLTLGCNHNNPIAGVYGHTHGHRGAWSRATKKRMLPSTVEVWSDAMGIDWMTAEGLAQAIPPAYTEHLGRKLLEALG
jgi:DNA (cytosine-5)-methyltransferase 1